MFNEVEPVKPKLPVTATAVQEAEAEEICRWAAARAGVIVIAPAVGTVALVANEVYMIVKIGEVYGVKINETAAAGFLMALGAAFVGQTLATLIPFAPMQIPIGVGVTYGVGKVAQEWIKAGMPEDVGGLKEKFDETRKLAKQQIRQMVENPLKNQALGDEKREFRIR
ncbi:MAG TPA: hypothetical protein VN611_10550 [Patescibacteria group bacterium]|nr:hypothetical protein [Patescibacteria group bacterium]